MTSQILEFTISNNLYVLDTRTGLYATRSVSAIHGAEVGLQDMLGIPGFSITKIINKTRTVHHRVEKTREYRITTDAFTDLPGTIISIYYKKNRAVVDFQPNDRRRGIIRAVDLTAVYDIPAVQTTPTPTPVATQQPARASLNTINLDTLQNIILGAYTRPIRLERTLRARRESLAEFISKLFEEWNGNNEIHSEKGDFKDTIYVDDHSVQTGWGRRRSLGDIFMICRYYYPTCTLREVLTILTDTLPDELEGFRSVRCSTINKRVYYLNPNAETAVLNGDYRDEYGYVYNDYVNALNS